MKLVMLNLPYNKVIRVNPEHVATVEKRVDPMGTNEGAITKVTMSNGFSYNVEGDPDGVAGMLTSEGP